MVALLDASGAPMQGMLRRVAICDTTEQGEIVDAKTMFLRQATVQDQLPAVKAALDFVNEKEGRERWRIAADVKTLYTHQQAVALFEQEARERQEAAGDDKS